MASIRAAAALLLALLATVAVPAAAWTELTTGGTAYCPISKWQNGATTLGAIIDPESGVPGSVEIAHYYGFASGPQDCANYCKNWGLTVANSIAGSSIVLADITKGCAFWTYLDLGLYTDNIQTGDCYLYTCGVCTSGTAYLPNAVQKYSSQWTFAYTSGMNSANTKSCTNIVGDPHFTGADNSHFDFTGTPNTTYALLSDAHLHMNMFLGGRYGEWVDEDTGTVDPHKAMTWIRQLSVLWGHHTITFAAREGAAWEYGAGYMSAIKVDGERVLLARGGDVARFADGQITITWVAARVADGDDEIDVYELAIPNVLTLRLKLRPEVESLRTPTDGVVHIGIEVPEVRLTANAHGVLGQTYRPDHRHRLRQQELVYSKLLGVSVVPGQNGQGFLDGSAEDYEVSGLLKTDCRLTRFTRARAVDPETARAIEIASGAASSSFSAPGRRMLRPPSASAAL